MVLKAAARANRVLLSYACCASPKFVKGHRPVNLGKVKCGLIPCGLEAGLNPHIWFHHISLLDILACVYSHTPSYFGFIVFWTSDFESP